jgi:uncharacterized protein (TIGR03437 family)
VRFASLLFLSLSSIYSVAAQTPATLLGAGYTAPTAPIPITSGQVVTLFFRGVSTLPNGSMRAGQAQTTPLPTVLAGLSVRFAQPQVRLPIFAVRQENDCVPGEINPACLLTSIRVQGPIDLSTVMEAVLEVDGQASRNFLFTLISDNAHVITSCDAAWDTNWASSCRRLLFHADGSAVSEKAPATRGETVIVYLWGLGVTSPRVPIGEASPPGVEVEQVPGVQALRARFNNGARTSLTAIPPFFSPEDANDPGSPIAFAGLTPGQVGLYQMNIPVPQSLNPTTPCGGEIVANAVLHITTLYGATQELGFCLRP